MNEYQQWEWNSTTKSYGPGKVQCHDGNTGLYKEPKGGTLFIGGWNNGAIITNNTFVIDLTGTEHKWYEIPVPMDEKAQAFMPYVATHAGWLSLPFPDYSTPSNLKTLEQWKGVAKEIKKLLKKGNDVLVACLGGHGRSGLFCSIVGYLLAIDKDKSWSSPVEHIRNVHCSSAVETYAQEKYVYNILGLDIQITHQYVNKGAVSTIASTSTSGIETSTTVQNCPICGKSSLQIIDYGLCMTCQQEWADKAPVKHDLTVEDIDHPVKHECTSGTNCIGIYKAAICGHVVHDVIINEGLCELCSWADNQKKNTQGEAIDGGMYGPCAMCERTTFFGKRYGMCWDCSEAALKAGLIDSVHDSILDGYRAVPHKCHETQACLGIMKADVCGHVVHNMEIMDGMCPDCLSRKEEATHEVQSNPV